MQVIEQAALEAQHVRDLNVVEVALRTHPDGGDLIFHGVGRRLGLLEQLHETLTAGELAAGRRIEVGGEHGEGGHRAVLREGELERTGDLTKDTEEALKNAVEEFHRQWLSAGRGASDLEEGEVSAERTREEISRGRTNEKA